MQAVTKLIRARSEPARSQKWTRTVFERVDGDGDGLIEFDELVAALAMLFSEPDPHAIAKLRTTHSSPATPSMRSELSEGSQGLSRTPSAQMRLC